MSGIAFMVDDMFFAAKISAAAEAAGRSAERLKSVERLKALAGDPPAMLLLDLNADRLDPLAVVTLCKADPGLRDMPIVGFLSHVQIDLKNRAEAAGCDYVIPRSLFSKTLPRLLAGDLSHLPPPRPRR